MKRHDLEPGLKERLRALPVPPPSADYVPRVLAAVRHAQRHAWRPFLGAALAASLAVGVGIGAWLGQRTDPADGALSVTLAQGVVSPVRLMFRAPHDLQGVEIHLQLPAGVELAGRPGRSELRWHADLQAGGNLLELPVIIQGGEGGVLTASVGLGQDRKQFVVLVKAKKEVSNA